MTAANRRILSLAAVAALAHAGMLPSLAADWPEWRGPGRTGIQSERGWMRAWPEGSQPRVAWRVMVGKGHSAVSVKDGRAFTMGWDGQQDTVFCLDAASGKVLWRFSYACRTILQWPGPRATPTLDGDRVYTLGQHGQLHAFEAATGRLLWRRDLPAGYNPDVDYGFAWSPLVERDLLILGGGARGVALRTADGAFAWGNDGRPGACASPVRYEAEGRRLVALVVNNDRENVQLVGVEPETGREVWRSPPWPEKWGAACVDPVVRDGSVFLTTAEQQVECARFRIDGNRAVKLWSNSRLACYTGSCVLVGNNLFGVTKAGILKCLDWDTGEERWAQRGFDGHGALSAVDDSLVVQASQAGDLVVARADGAAYRELRRIRPFTGQPETFTAPVVANGRLYCRSYAGELVCLATGSQGS